MDKKAQISMELLIILAAVIAVAIVLVSSMVTSSNTFDAKLDSNSKKILKDLGRLK